MAPRSVQLGAILTLGLTVLVMVLPFLPLVIVLAAYLESNRWLVAGLLGW